MSCPGAGSSSGPTPGSPPPPLRPRLRAPPRPPRRNGQNRRHHPDDPPSRQSPSRHRRRMITPDLARVSGQALYLSFNLISIHIRSYAEDSLICLTDERGTAVSSMLGVATHPCITKRKRPCFPTLPRPGSGLQTLPGTGRPCRACPRALRTLRFSRNAVACYRALERLRELPAVAVRVPGRAGGRAVRACRRGAVRGIMRWRRWCSCAWSRSSPGATAPCTTRCRRADRRREAVLPAGGGLPQAVDGPQARGGSRSTT